MSIKLGFLGGGSIARSIINGIVKAGVYTKQDICIFDVDITKKEYFRKEGFRVCTSEEDLVRSTNFVFLAVRPSDIKTVLAKISPAVSSSNVIISLAAGISIQYIKRSLRRDCKVVRAMPNTASGINKGATAISYAMPITYNELNMVKDLFESLGVVEMLDEQRMNEVISVNSSSPAFAYMLMRAMITGAVNQGIPEDVAKTLVLQTIDGAVQMLKNEDGNFDISAKINEICSPNGTTIKAVEYLEKRGFEQSVSDAMLACTRRASMIEKEIDMAQG